MAKNLSEVFKEAKKSLWDGSDLNYWDIVGMEFICHAIDEVGRTPLEFKAKAIIQQRLGVNDEGKDRTVTCYLRDVIGVSWEDRENSIKVQKYRRDWLTSLEKEFKEK